jgi:RHH-type transcriptional regulator, proline utilization regulon repressor / proline dehydrogenase / delta 1-pyrroline-5-carboxylate dehydrogenase
MTSQSPPLPISADAMPAPRLPPPVRDEDEVMRQVLGLLEGFDWAAATATAEPWVVAVRTHPAPFWALESLLGEYPIASREGLALMRLAEALLRVPDTGTAALLAADQLGQASFRKDDSDSTLKALSGRLLSFSRRLLPEDDAATRGLIARLGAGTVVAAAVRAIALLGKQFVLGETLEQASRRALAARREQPNLTFSYDMLGEGARTAQDAARHAESYRATLLALSRQHTPGGPELRDGMSIKLSALHPRFEEAQRGRVLAELLPLLEGLARQAAAAEVNLTLDAEESERLELQIDLLDALAARLAGDRAAAGWTGLGLAVQAYLTRAPVTVEAVIALARSHRMRLMVRLVKGAYWDAEIKRAQELGLAGYPVFTHKHHSDACYLACARIMLDAAAADDSPLYPQFATHNAGTAAAVLHLAAQRPAVRFEFQRLHGMGEGIYREILKDPAVRCRVYAPVGEHRDLLAYLVRRLLENGANTSFVHLLADTSVPAQELLYDPLWIADRAALPAPRELYGLLHGEKRVNPLGFDPAAAPAREPVLAAARALPLPAVATSARESVDPAVRALDAAFPSWDATPLAQRCDVLLRAADLLEQRRDAFVALVMREAHRTLADALSEVQEATDYCRYYALQARHLLAEQELPGPTGESNALRSRGRGVFACISPWNFPLAIFAGQVLAALVSGNTVAAKPAEQTPAIAQAFVELLFEAGLPREVLNLLNGAGETVGAALVEHALVAGVAFTGSTAVARIINRRLAAKEGPIVPLIAETGGINAMIVDSTALPEQVVDAVVSSAFRSAGQRCSSLRLLCLQDDVAGAMLEMLAGAMCELRIGPACDLATDVPPVIDADAWNALRTHGERLQREARLVARTPWPAELARLGDSASGATATERAVLALRCPEPALSPWAQPGGRMLHFIAPSLFEIADVAQAGEEIFGPVLQVARWKAGQLDALIDAINGLGYGLTLGVQTRIDGRARRIAERTRCGNVYVNRNMIGAVVGVQPFGGERLSGTGPKAGGPHYLLRFCGEQTATVNTAAAGGNAALLAQAAL